MSWLTSSQVESIAYGSVTSSKVNASTNTSLHQNLVVEGDIVVETGTYLIENIDLNLTGKITASNDATIMIRNATLFLTTRGFTTFRDGIVLTDNSKLIAENATIVVKSANPTEESYIIAGDESTANITDSRLDGIALIIGRQNSRTYVNRSVLKGPDPVYLRVFGVITENNSMARIRDSELDVAGARGNSSVYVFNSTVQTRVFGENGLMEVESSDVGYASWFWGNSELRILDSTIHGISFGGLSLIVRDSQVVYEASAQGNSTAWLTNVSASRVSALHNSTLWLINSHTGEIDTRDQGKVYVGWQLPLLGLIAVPHTWLPILQGFAVLAALVLIIALLVLLNRQWKRWQLQKLKQQSQTSHQS